MPQFRKLVRRTHPNLHLDNLKYHRAPSPTPEERKAAKRAAAAAARAAGQTGVSTQATAKLAADLDALFAV